MLILPEHSITTLDTIHHADCFDLMNGLASQSVDAIITDMPYAKTQAKWDNAIDFKKWWRECKRILKPIKPVITTAMQPFGAQLICSNVEWFRYELIWHKTQATGHLNCEIMPLREHENIMLFCEQMPAYYPQMEPKPTENIRPNGCGSDNLGDGSNAYGGFKRNSERLIPLNMTYPRSVMKFANPNHGEAGLHPTQKPVALYEYLIKTYTQTGDIVLDPFCGSGTTALAAFRTGRHYICGDSDAGYVDIARQRLAVADPYQDKPLDAHTTQLSLFAPPDA